MEKLKNKLEEKIDIYKENSMIVQIKKIFLNSNNIFIVSEYIEGCTLKVI